MMDFLSANQTRYRRGQPTGHYESYFQRANHPTRPLAFWIRYTIFAPAGSPEGAIAELWAVYFDGETHEHVAVKSEFPYSRASFDPDDFRVRIEDATLDRDGLYGRAGSDPRSIGWRLRYEGEEPPLLLYEPERYESSFPKAKALVGLPFARYEGELDVAGKTISIDGWIGSQNHNWGSRHTDEYAWGQVAGFDDASDVFLEIGTGRLKMAGLWTPRFTPMVIRRGGEEIALRTLRQAVHNRGKYEPFAWHFAGANERFEIEGSISAPSNAFVGLRYYNPPGGIKHCLNSKIAAAEIRIFDRERSTRDVFITRSRAAFEILTDRRDHGIRLDA
jgi:hypothetical protein